MNSAQATSIPLLNKRDQDTLIANVSRNPKHKLMALLMLDCGLRVTEVAKLQIKHFNFKENKLVIPSLKKRTDKPVYRSIPMTTRVLEAMSDYYIRIKDKTPDAFIFPTSSNTGHISRIRIWRMIKKYSNWSASPHVLRHTFATKVVAEGNDIRVAQDLLGHASYKTTEIYLHVPESDKRAAIKSIDKRTTLQKIKDKLIPRKNVFYLNHLTSKNKIHVGRKDEMKMINKLFHQKINILVTGDQGIGKSSLLKEVQGEKILRIDDFKSVKKTLGNILLKLYDGDKEKIIDLLTDQANINQIITKENNTQLINLLKRTTKPLEYSLIIDDLSHVTGSGVTVLEKLKNHFHIIAAARQIKVSQSSFLTNFQKINLKPLSRIESTKMIYHLSKEMRNRIEDYESYKNHVYDQTNGNPLFITEMIERFSKEPEISRDHIQDIRHTAALTEIDVSMPLVIMISSLMVLRYIGGEFNDDTGAYRLFGGAFLLFALYARSVFNFGKRKWV